MYVLTRENMIRELFTLVITALLFFPAQVAAEQTTNPSQDNTGVRNPNGLTEGEQAARDIMYNSATSGLNIAKNGVAEYCIKALYIMDKEVFAKTSLNTVCSDLEDVSRKLLSNLQAKKRP